MAMFVQSRVLFWVSLPILVLLLAGNSRVSEGQMNEQIPEVRHLASSARQSEQASLPVPTSTVESQSTPKASPQLEQSRGLHRRQSAFVGQLADVPELMLAEPHPKAMQPKDEIDALACAIAEVNRLNDLKTDGYLKQLLTERADLADLPFQMGDKCRLSATRSRHFRHAVQMVHSRRNTRDDGNGFLQAFLQACVSEDFARTSSHAKEELNLHAVPARLAAMTQICDPTADNMKLAFVKYLESVSSAEATRALARTVLFSSDEDSRTAAVEALKSRRERDYTELLMAGLRYPWPEVEMRAAAAVAKLGRNDLLPQMIDILAEADPRAPIVKRTNGAHVAEVRELVRINHHRNCLLCHAPGQSEAKNENVLTAQIPLASQPLPASNEGSYGSKVIPELLVRVDVTYLRQDFSLMLPVPDAAPWPEMQRFDFVVRTRVLKDDELQAYKDKFDKLESGVLPPNHRAALFALRELTGKDTAPTAEAWRKLLNLPK